MAAQENQDSENLAVLFEVPDHPLNKYKGDEVGKMAWFRDWADKVFFERDSRNTALSILCANHLFALIDKFLNPPSSPHLNKDLQIELQLNNVYFQMLWLLEQLMQSYWLKFLRSTKPAASKKCRELIRVMTQRTIIVVPIWIRLGYLREGKNPEHWPMDPEGMFSGIPPSSQLLWMLAGLLRGFVKEVEGEELLPPALKEEFLHHLVGWYQYPEARFSRACGQLSMYLTPEGIQQDKALGIGAFGVKAEWHHCGVRSCHIEQSTPGEFKICSRCRTVRYCSEAHQKQDWKAGHKRRCFETTY